MDPRWLAHRKYAGPTSEDLRPLAVPDPLVLLRLAVHPGSSTSSTGPSYSNSNTHSTSANSSRSGGLSRATAATAAAACTNISEYDSAFGLRHGVDPSSLLPRYCLSLPAEQVLGVPNPHLALDSARLDDDYFDRDCILGLTSSAGALLC